jgi:hypothetical protein
MLPTSDVLRDQQIARDVVELELATIGEQFIDPIEFDARSRRALGDLRGRMTVLDRSSTDQPAPALERFKIWLGAAGDTFGLTDRPGAQTVTGTVRDTAQAVSRIPSQAAARVREGVSSVGDALASVAGGARTTGIVLAVALLGIGLIAAAKAIRG